MVSSYLSIDSQPVVEDLDASHFGGDADQFVCATVSRAGRERRTDLDIGLLDFNQDCVLPILNGLAAVRQEHLYGFRFGCRATGGIDAEAAQLFRKAGIAKVKVVAPTGHLAKSRIESEFLRLVTAVMVLDLEGIEVSWALPTWAGSLEAAELLCPLMSFLHHVPPPQSPANDEAKGIKAAPVVRAVSVWWDRHQPHVLTYGHGPGFVRICDRREAVDAVRFITLRDAQAAVFLAARTPVAIDVLERAAGGVAPVLLQRFLDNLVDARLMCRTDSGLYLRLPVRRRIEERWVEGDS